MDEADRLHAVGHRRLPPAGKYQPRPHALPARSPGAKTDDRATGAAGNDVAKGVSGDSQAPGQRQRPGIAGLSRALKNVPAAVELLPGTLSVKALPDRR